MRITKLNFEDRNALKRASRIRGSTKGQRSRPPPPTSHAPRVDNKPAMFPNQKKHARNIALRKQNSVFRARGRRGTVAGAPPPPMNSAPPLPGSMGRSKISKTVSAPVSSEQEITEAVDVKISPIKSDAKADQPTENSKSKKALFRDGTTTQWGSEDIDVLTKEMSCEMEKLESRESSLRHGLPTSVEEHESDSDDYEENVGQTRMPFARGENAEDGNSDQKCRAADVQIEFQPSISD